ncbi:MAG: leucine-rich repeat domain-containing protein [Pseudomonadota bacterium]
MKQIPSFVELPIVPNIPEDVRPRIAADGRIVRLDEIEQLKADAVFIGSIRQDEFNSLCPKLQTQHLVFADLRVADVSALTRVSDLRHLSITWSTKLSDIGPLAELTGLESLVLSDVKKVTDISPLAALSGLRALVYEGGIWNKQTAETLEPLTALTRLEELQMTNLKVGQGGLRPLARLQSLRLMILPNQFPTEEFAYLAAHLPHVECDLLAPAVQIDPGSFDGKDLMITGSRKPFLNSTTDAAKVQKYTEAFAAMVAKFQAEI